MRGLRAGRARSSEGWTSVHLAGALLSILIGFAIPQNRRWDGHIPVDALARSRIDLKRGLEAAHSIIGALAIKCRTVIWAFIRE
jgi:hypothetical protein